MLQCLRQFGPFVACAAHHQSTERPANTRAARHHAVRVGRAAGSLGAAPLLPEPVRMQSAKLRRIMPVDANECQASESQTQCK